MTGFLDLFPQCKPIIGMLHLAGDNPVQRALEELAIYEDEGVDGAIVENYHGDIGDVKRALEAIVGRGTPLRIGVNILPNEFVHSLALARDYGASFIQLDHVAGTYTKGALPVDAYLRARDAHPGIVVLGGVWPKYYTPLADSDLKTDIRTGLSRADALVVTGVGTGKETPLGKLRTFRDVVGTQYPLIVGAGLTAQNAVAQLTVADAAIVGSSFKTDGETHRRIEPQLVKNIMRTILR